MNRRDAIKAAIGAVGVAALPATYVVGAMVNRMTVDTTAFARGLCKAQGYLATPENTPPCKVLDCYGQEWKTEDMQGIRTQRVQIKTPIKLVPRA